MEALKTIGLLYLATVILEYITRGCQTLLTAISVHRMIRDMREALTAHILNLSSSFHDKNMSGALVTRATSDFDNLSESLNQGVLSSIVDIAVLIGALVGLFMLDSKLALITIVIIPIVGFIVTRFSKSLKRTMLAARKWIASLNAFTQESLFNVKTVKLLNGENDVNQKYESLAYKYRDAQMKSVILDSVMFSLLDGISSITIGVILWFALDQMSISSTLSAGVMVAFVQYTQNLFDPLKQLGNKIAMLQGAFTAIDRIFYIFSQNDFIEGSDTLDSIKGEVNIENLSFAYSGEEEAKVLNEINLNIPAGKSLAIVGSTGSGKSTLIKLIAKLYDGYNGNITIDGNNISLLDPNNYRSLIAIVPQDITLFEGSVLFNITLNDPNISEASALKASKDIGLDKIVKHFPGGYGYVIKENGSNLSLGQKQLISFARAMAKDPKIIILDEATSSIDPESERLIQNAISKVLAQRTAIIIAHRLSTIEQCDEIIVMERGQIVEKGIMLSL